MSPTWPVGDLAIAGFASGHPEPGKFPPPIDRPPASPESGSRNATPPATPAVAVRLKWSGAHSPRIGPRADTTDPTQDTLPPSVAPPPLSAEPCQPSVGAVAGGTPVIGRSPVGGPPPAAAPDTSVTTPGSGRDIAPATEVDAPGPAIALPAVRPPPLEGRDASPDPAGGGAEEATDLLHQNGDQQIEIRRLRYEERVRFHQELREALNLHGVRAGTAIDQLCDRYGYESDNVRFEKASRVWTMSNRPLAYRVGRFGRSIYPRR